MRAHWRIVLATFAGLAVTQFTADLAKLVPLPQSLDSIAYLRSGISYLFDIALMVLLLRMLGGVSFARQWTATGLGQPARPALLMGLCLFVPLVLSGLVLGRLSDEESPSSLLFLGLIAPFAEEVTYRGLAAGGLMLLAGWRFWPAALSPAILFGLIHLSQGEGLVEIASVVAITAVGGLFFAWLYVRFGNNLWPAVVMHVGINSLWNLFDLGDNAIGSAIGNVLRVATVLGALAFAIWGQPWLERVSATRKTSHEFVPLEPKG